jgi:hypothetical protein
LTYPFGKAFERWYYPLVNDTTPEGTILTSQTPAIYVFTTNPGRSVAATGVGALKTITSWTWDANQAGWRYTITAISDPSPTSSQTLYTYWEAVNFRLEAGADIQTDLRALEMERISGHSTAVNVTDEMLRQYFPQLDSCSTESQRVQQLVLAIEDVKARLKAKGYEWAKITRPDRLTIAIAYRVLYMIMLVQIQQGNDKYAIKYAEFKAIFESTIDSLSLEYDSNGDGQADTTVTASIGVVFLSR